MESAKYDVFISYSRKDYVDDQKNVIPNNVVSRIKDAFTEAGISYWFDEEGINHGDKFAKLIVKNIKASRIFVFISTQNANESEWTGREIASAHMMKKRIIPVRVDDSTYHEDVMFYISILDYIDYKANPTKGTKDLVKTIKTYLAEEQEAERQQLLAEEERRKQEEDLIRRQRQMENLKLEIKQSEIECSQLEEQVLFKKHELESIHTLLDKKKNLLDERKTQLHTILYGGKQKDDNVIGTTSYVDLETGLLQEKISWRHPIKRIKQTWNIIDRTATKRNLITNFFFELAWIIGLLYFLVGSIATFAVSLIYACEGHNILIASISFFYLWGVSSILKNERKGFWCCIITPVIVFPIWGIVRGFSEALLMSISALFASIPVLSLLFLRKNKKSAWSLMAGSWKDLLEWRDKIMLYVGWIILFIISICYSYVRENRLVSDSISTIDVESEYESAPNHPLQNELDSIQTLLDEEREYVYSINKMITYSRRHMFDDGKRYIYYDDIHELEKRRAKADSRIESLISQYNIVCKDTVSVASIPQNNAKMAGKYHGNNPTHETSRETQKER